MSTTDSQDYYISSTWSQLVGVIVSILVALGIILAATLSYYLVDHVWQIGAVVGVIFGPRIGFATYYRGLQVQNWVQLNWIALGTTNDALNGYIYGPGTHWLWRWRPLVQGLIPFPGPQLYLQIAMPGEAIDAADNFTINTGVDAKGEPNAIQGRIVDVFKYYRLGSEEMFYRVLAEAYLDAVRLFINQTLYGMGVVNKSYLLKRYLMLPPLSEDTAKEHEDFTSQLKKATHVVNETARPLYSEDSIAAIMSEAGKFRLKLQNRGFEVEGILLPNLRQNEAVESLAVVSTLSSDIQKKTGVSAEIATAISAQAAGIPQHQMMIQVPGIPPALLKVAESLTTLSRT